MREVEFKAWLGRRRYRGKPLRTISQRLNWCRAVERASSAQSGVIASPCRSQDAQVPIPLTLL